MKNSSLKVLAIIGLIIMVSFGQSLSNDIHQTNTHKQLLTSKLHTRASSIPSNEARLLQNSNGTNNNSTNGNNTKIDASTGTLKVGNLTVLCNPGCGQCTSVDVCTKCGIGLFSNGGKCARSQVTGCRTAASLTTCSQCFDGFYLNSNNTCTKCAETCLTCSGSASSCLTCKKGNYLSGTSCVACISDCDDCTSATGCITCRGGFTYIAQAASCVRCPTAGCASCTLSSCTKCADGLQLTNVTCTPCPTGCTACTSGVCTACRSGLQLTTEKTCIRSCIFPCATCVRSESACTSCIGGYSFVGGSCVANLSCSDNSTCTACPIGYSLQTGKCVKCNGGPNCQGCTPGNSSKCLTCVRGYYIVVSNSSNTCSKCPTECALCSDQISCTSCADGYYLSGSSCQPCDSSCATCFGTARNCETCANRFTRRGAQCRRNSGARFRFVFRRSFSAFSFLNLNNLISALAKLTKTSTDDCAVDPLKAGPASRLLQGNDTGTTQAGGSISSTDPAATSSAIAAGAPAGSTIAGLTVSTSQVTAVSDPASTEQDWKYYRNVAIIVGVVIPVSLIIIFIIFFIGYKNGVWCNEGYQQTNKYPDYSNERII